ncbi:MAG: hypothetical protein SOI46_07095 [Eggerthellaceae bacterium]|jgi:hypothetical protein
MAGLLDAVRTRARGRAARGRYVEVARGCVESAGEAAAAGDAACAGESVSAQGTRVRAGGSTGARGTAGAAVSDDLTGGAVEQAARACRAASEANGSEAGSSYSYSTASSDVHASAQSCESGKANSRSTSPSACAEFATFRSLYTSRDGWYALYEDHFGHLTSVNTARFV